MLRRRKRNRFKFTEKKHSRKGIACLAIASILLVIFIVFLEMAYSNSKAVNTYYASAGVFVMLCSIVVFVFSAQSIKEEDSFPLFPRLSFGISLLTMICWLGTYINGFISLYF